ncbi:MAG TPA: hypothetical protein VFW23_02335 [Tepidisphaeraceae bacterium]|nr:hypothetical protein [Tepidisphaeraceae bacterium]
MPHDQDKNPRTQSARTERPVTTASLLNAQFGDVSGNIKAGLRAQKQMLDVLHDVSHAWFARAASQTELAFRLPARLTSVQTLPDALSTYQEWLNEWVDGVDQDSRRMISDSKRVMDESVRCFTIPSSHGTT